MPKLPDVTAFGARPQPNVTAGTSGGLSVLSRAVAEQGNLQQLAGRGELALSESMRRAGELIALGEERISARRDSIERLRAIEQFNTEGNDELLRLSTEEDMASEDVAAKYRAFLDAKRTAILGSHTGSPDSRVRLAERLYGIHGELTGRAVATSIAAQEELVKGTIGRYINSSVTHAYDPSTTLDDLFNSFGAVVDDIDSLSERERETYKRVGREQIAEAKVMSLLMRGASAEAEELLGTLDLPEILGPGTQGKLRAQIAQFDNAVMNAALEGQATRASLEAFMRRPVSDIEAQRKAGINEPTPQVAVNVGPTGIDYGDPEAGLAWARNPDGTVRLDERGAPIGVPYQGGSVAREEAAAKGKAATQQQQTQTAADVVIVDVDRALKLIETSVVPVTGIGSYLSGVAGTPARNLAGLIEAIESNVGFDRLQQMRAASPTGGALGAVNVKELELLTSSLGSLKQSQSEEQFVENLKRVKEIYLDIVHGPGNRPLVSMDFSKMEIDEISKINLSTLSEADKKALDKRLTELGFE